MTKQFKVKSFKTSKIVWGFFWLLLAGLVLANYFGGFVQLGVWSIIVSVIALIILFQSLATLNLAAVPIPIAALYYIFQTPFNLPEVVLWPTLVVVTILVTIGLSILLPRRLKSGKFVNVDFGSNSSRKHNKHKNKVNVHIDDDDLEIIIDESIKDDSETSSGVKIEEGDDENNPYINVSFGYASRYLHADCLESAELICSFGGMEVYFDNVTLSPNGADINVSCSFGSVEIYVPSHWRVIDEMNASLANAEVNRNLLNNDDDAPTIRVTGSVSLGNAEIKRIKG